MRIYLSMMKYSLLIAATLAAANATDLKSGIHNIVDGAGNIIEGAANHLENKASQFVDSAGNVYEVVKDTAGNATNLVKDAAGAVFDVSKIAGSFIIDSIVGYPGDVINSARESQAEMRAAMGAAGNMLGAMAGAAYMPSMPPLKQVLHPGAWAQAGQENWDKAHEAMGAMSAAWSGPYNVYEEKYCTKPTLVPSKKVGTKIVMPGFFMEITMGSCTVENDEALADCLFNKNCDKDALELACKKPEIVYEHTPGKITYKHHTATTFTSKDCKVKKEHGKKEELVLHEFTTHNVDLKTLANQVSQTVGNAVGGLASSATNLASDVGSFVGGLKHDKADFEEFVAKYDGVSDVSGYDTVSK